MEKVILSLKCSVKETNNETITETKEINNITINQQKNESKKQKERKQKKQRSTKAKAKAYVQTKPIGLRIGKRIPITVRVSY